MRILFAGTPDIALYSLEALYGAGPSPGGRAVSIAAVLTNPDAPRGRKRALRPSPVKERAQDLGLAVLQPERLDGDARRVVNEYRPDLLVVVAYGKIFGPRFLELFPRGGVNVHPSLLPRHRGPSPIPAAILAGDRITGVTVQRLAREMDAGDILEQREVALPPRATTPELERELGGLGAEMLVRQVQCIADGTEQAVAQDSASATYCSLLTRDDGRITWGMGAVEIDRMVRAYTPWPGVRCMWKGTVLHLIETDVVGPDVRETGRASMSAVDGSLPGNGPPPGKESAPGDCPPPGEGSPPGGCPPPGMVRGVDNGKGILVQTGSGTLVVKRLKLQSRKEMDFRSFLNGNSSIIGDVLEQA